MSGIKVTWNMGAFSPEKHYIYRSDSPIDPNNLPTPLAEVGQGISEYNDLTIVDGETYYYFVAAEKMGLLCPADDFITVAASGVQVDIFNDGSGVATYLFDGDAIDVGGTWNGTWNGTENYATGIDGMAASFDGTNYITGAPPLSVAELSVSFWVKNPSNASFGFDRCMVQQNDFFVFVNANGTGGFIRTSSIFSSAGVDTWHHYVMNVYTDDTFEVYMDNSLMSLTQGTSTTASQYGGGVIGASNTTGNYPFMGEIDHFRIFNRPLTSGEINTLYNEVGGV